MQASESDRREMTTAQIVQELGENLEFLQAILESSGECIKVLDLDGRLEFISAAGVRVMELEDFAAVAGRSWLSFWQEPERARAAAAFERARSGDVDVFQGPCATAKGTPHVWEVTVRPIPGRDGGLWRILVISRDITALHASQEHQFMLLNEMHHRMRNIMSAVLAITSQSFRTAESTEEARAAIESRLVALGKANELLIASKWQGADLKSVIGSALRAHDEGNESRFDVEGGTVHLSSRAALAMTLALNELATNAMKYGALSNATGRVHIHTRMDEAAKRFQLTWQEQGGPPVREPTRRGFGSRLIKANFEGQLQGKFSASYASSGFSCAFDAPLAALQDRA
jgi:PAS domain S-box-containing protein